MDAHKDGSVIVRQGKHSTLEIRQHRQKLEVTEVFKDSRAYEVQVVDKSKLANILANFK
jgi:hypothetical protein